MTARAEPAGGTLRLTVLLTTALAAAGFANFVASVMSPFLIDEFGWDRWQVGAQVTAFSLSGAAGSPIMGWYADRIGGRGALLVVWGSVAAGLLLFAAAPGFVPMLGVMMVAGFAASAANPSTNKLIGDHIAPELRSTVVGIKQAGGPVGIAILGFLPVLAETVGWRTAAALAAILPITGFVATLVLLNPSPGSADVGRSKRTRKRSMLVRRLAFQGALVGLGGSAVISFVPLYAEEQLAFSASRAGLVATVFGVLAVAGRVLWGWQHHRVGDVTTSLMVVNAASIATPLLLLAADVAGEALLWVGVGLGGLSFMAWNVFAMLAVIDGVAGADAGRASGDVVLGFLVGFTIGPTSFGLLVDATGSYTWGWLAAAGAFVAATAAGRSLRGAIAGS